MKKVSRKFNKKLKYLNLKMEKIMGYSYNNAFSLLEELSSNELQQKAIQMIHNEDEDVMERIKTLTSAGYTINTISSRLLIYAFEYNSEMISSYKEQLKEYPDAVIQNLLYIVRVFKFFTVLKYYALITLINVPTYKVDETMTEEDLLEDVKSKSREENKESPMLLCNFLSRLFLYEDRTLKGYYSLIFNNKIVEILDYIICDLDGYSYYLYRRYKEEVSQMNDAQLKNAIEEPMETGDYRSAVLEVEFYYRQYKNKNNSL